MTGSPQPWAKPVRILVLSTLVVAIGVGLVVALYDRGFLPIAGPFVAMLLAPLILLFRSWWLQRREAGAVDPTGRAGRQSRGRQV
jgi:hypothetical protein